MNEMPKNLWMRVVLVSVKYLLIPHSATPH